MRVTTTLKHPQGGLLSDLIGADLAAKKLAFKVAVAKSARALEKDIEDGLRSVGLPKLAPLMASAAYPQREGVGSFEAQGVVYVKAGPQFQAAIALAAGGGTVRARGGRFLAIPTGAHPRARTPGAVGWTPSMMVESGAAFLIRRRGGPGFLWMLRVAASKPTGRGGRAPRVVVSAALMARARGARGGVAAVPMFLLLPELTVRARLNVPAMVSRRFDDVQSRYDDEFRRIIGG